MQSNNQSAQQGGLNFVFESGSPGRDNQKYVRSHAAKIGWSQRARNKDAKKAEAANVPTPARKRRKTQGQTPTDQPPARQDSSIEAESSAHPTIHRSVNTHPVSYGAPEFRTSLNSPYPPAGQFQMHNISSNGSNYHGSEPSQNSGPSYARPPYAYSQLQSHSLVHTNTRVPANTYYYETRPGYAEPSQPPFLHHSPQPLQPQSHTRQYSAPQVYTMKPGPSHTSSTSPCSVLPSHSLPTPASSPSLVDSATEPAPTSLWSNPHTDYENYPANRSRSRKRARRSVEERNESPAECGELILRSPPPSRSGSRSRSPYFLDVVMNPDYPFCPSVDSGQNTFKVFPVRWEPFYSRLIENYRANMLVQLEEITTGWSFQQRLAFNQMPLRLAMSEPALFHALLAVAAIMMPPGLINPCIPQLLQSRTVEALNSAFSDPARATSDATILTVNLIALFESTGGSATTAANIHQPALRKMVDLRGGLESLYRGDDMDARNFVRMLAWTDRVIWCQTGNELMFGEFKEDASVSGTNWDDIWDRMTMRVEEQKGKAVHVEVLE